MSFLLIKRPCLVISTKKFYYQLVSYFLTNFWDHLNWKVSICFSIKNWENWIKKTKNPFHNIAHAARNKRNVKTLPFFDSATFSLTQFHLASLLILLCTHCGYDKTCFSCSAYLIISFLWALFKKFLWILNEIFIQNK